VDAWEPSSDVGANTDASNDSSIHSAATSTSDSIVYAGRSVQSSDLVEIKQQDYTTGREPIRPRLLANSWLTCVDKLCFATLTKNSTITTKMQNLTNLRAEWILKKGNHIGYLHGILRALKSSIPRDRVGAYLVRVQNPGSALLTEHVLELYGVDMDDSILKNRMHEFVDQFPAPKTPPV
jgi:hypothetical protein